MFIYNITTKVNWQINDAWLDWMLNEHMQAVVHTKCFTKYTLLRLHDVDDVEGTTYAVQYFTESRALYNRYNELYHANFIEEINKKWGDGILMFSTFMEIIS